MRSLIECVSVICLLLAVGGFVHADANADHETLRVCGDPNNLPFSNETGAGFENRLAELVAQKLGMKLRYTWWAQRRGFVSHTLKAGACDVIMGVPAGYGPVETTLPYYRSTYVFVSRVDRKLDISSIEDARLRELKIGVHLLGNEGTNTPPAHALGEEGMTGNVVGFTIYGDYRKPNPPARLIEAVETGEIDLAAAWGPLAGFAAKQSAIALSLMPIRDMERFAPLRAEFDIAMGVRHGDDALRDKLDTVIAENRTEFETILRDFGVPLIPLSDEAVLARLGEAHGRKSPIRGDP
ncbi:MAG: substrate-binding domain-containing protein [Hyphomicrobiales bacterium]|nr:substrate-binding domain-containing protein [Hyphomicrobiales bacterium]